MKIGKIIGSVVPVGIILAGVFTSSSVLADNPVRLPGNVCRAALDSQASHFRTFPDRYKNQSQFPTFIVCPVHISGAGSNGESFIGMNAVFANETGSTTTISCNWFGYRLNNSLAPPVAVNSRSLVLQPGVAAGMFPTLDHPSGNALAFTHTNLVCLLQPGTSIVYFQLFDGEGGE